VTPLTAGRLAASTPVTPDPTVPAEVPAEVLRAREGTGTAFPAALAAHARRPGALADAAAWWSSADPVARLVGLELSAVLAGPASPLAVAERGPALAQVTAQAADAATSDDADLRWSAAKALGSVGPSGQALAVLLRLARDPDPDVRWQALGCLPMALGTEPGALEGPAAREVVAVLVAATADAEDEIAEQAVFVLAEQLDTAGAAAAPAVADALAAHLPPPGTPAADDEAGSGERASLAALALARRDDPRAEPAVRARLAQALEAVRSESDPDAAAELDDAWLEAAELLPGLAPLLADVRAAR